MNIVILAAGSKNIDSRIENYLPSFLAEINGVSALEKIIRSLNYIAEKQYVFALNQKDATNYHLDSIVKLMLPNIIISNIPNDTMGSACTAILAVCGLDQSKSLLIISANELIKVNFNKVINHFKNNKMDAGTIVFQSLNPRYSFVKLNDKKIVVEAAQQNPISQTATTGAFWFKTTHDFLEGAKNMIRKDVVTNGQYYIAPVLNELILKNKKIGIYEIKKNLYMPLKTALHVEKFQNGVL